MNQPLRARDKSRVEQATVRLETLGGLGTLVPGGFILTATHCIHWDGKGGMVLGDVHPENILSFSGVRFRVGLAACDPVSDMAALDELDGQEFEDADSFGNWREQVEPVRLSTIRLRINESCPVWILSHTGKWITGAVTRYGVPWNPPRGTLCLETREPIQGGDSGGPVVTAQGELIGVVSNYHSSSDGKGGPPQDHGGTVAVPSLALPRWLLTRIEAASRTRAR